MSTELTRRSVLAGALGIAVGGGAWWLHARRQWQRTRAALLELAHASGLAADGARLGRSYLEAYPEEADPSALVRLLLPGGAGADPVGARLAERIDRDWAELDTVQAEGWILARTEGRLLALVTLLETGAV